MLSQDQIKDAIRLYNEVVDVVHTFDELDDFVNNSTIDTFNYDYDLVDINYGALGTTVYISLMVDTRVDYWVGDYEYTIELKDYAERLDNSNKLCYNDNVKGGTK